MSIQPRFTGHILNTATKGHTIDLYFDYVCPFCAKAWKTIRGSVIDAAEAKYPNTFSWVFRHTVQPWHPASTLVHEAALAVESLAPAKFWDFSDALFEHQKDYFDTVVYHESRLQTYERLAKLAKESVGVEEKAFLDLVSIPPSETPSNGGNKVTNNLKLFIRQHRQNSVHMTPSLAVDGIISPAFSSSWTTEQWVEFLDGVVAAK
ncbi:thioredoxin-like protein [Dipodascopsis tothii]|uniref:thioredoxin-like protein n=1 Tax=Dipodascopsis tothii TaxID=44089 RepID=UPI0034CD95F7